MYSKNIFILFVCFATSFSVYGMQKTCVAEQVISASNGASIVHTQEAKVDAAAFVDQSKGYSVQSAFDKQGHTTVIVGTPYNIAISFHPTTTTARSSVLWNLGQVVFNFSENWLFGIQLGIFDGRSKQNANSSTTTCSTSTLQGIDIKSGEIAIQIPEYIYCGREIPARDIVIDDCTTRELMREAMPIIDTYVRLRESKNPFVLEQLVIRGKYVLGELQGNMYHACNAGQAESACAWFQEQFANIQKEYEKVCALFDVERAIAQKLPPDRYTKYLTVSTYNDGLVRSTMRAAIGKVNILRQNIKYYLPVGKLREWRDELKQQIKTVQNYKASNRSSGANNEINKALWELRAQECVVCLKLNQEEQAIQTSVKEWLVKNYNHKTADAELQEQVVICQELGKLQEPINRCNARGVSGQELSSLEYRCDILHATLDAIEKEYQMQLPISDTQNLLAREALLTRHSTTNRRIINEFERCCLRTQIKLIHQELCKRFVKDHVQELNDICNKLKSSESPAEKALLRALEQTLQSPDELVVVDRTVPVHIKEQIQRVHGDPNFFDHTVESPFGQEIYQQCYDSIVTSTELKSRTDTNSAFTDLVATKTAGMSFAAVEQALLGNYSLAADLHKCSDNLLRLYGMAQGTFKGIVVKPCQAFVDLSYHVFNKYSDCVLQRLIEKQPKGLLEYAHPLAAGMLGATAQLIREGINVPIAVGDIAGDALIFAYKLQKGYPGACEQYRSIMQELAQLDPIKQGELGGEHILSLIFPVGEAFNAIDAAVQSGITTVAKALNLEDRVERLTQTLLRKPNYAAATPEGLAMPVKVADEVEGAADLAARETAILQEAESAVKAGGEAKVAAEVVQNSNVIGEAEGLKVLQADPTLGEVEKNIENLKKIVPDIRYGRAEQRIKSAVKYLEAEANAEKKYAKFRSSSVDVEAIAKNLKIDSQVIQQIKDYVFYCDKQIFRDLTIGKFPASIEMAEAWERLVSGDFVQSDLVLLLHEYSESVLKKTFPNTTASNIHDIVQIKHNWIDSI